MPPRAQLHHAIFVAINSKCRCRATVWHLEFRPSATAAPVGLVHGDDGGQVNRGDDGLQATVECAVEDPWELLAHLQRLGRQALNPRHRVSSLFPQIVKRLFDVVQIDHFLC